MARVQIRVVTSNPGSNVFATFYTVPAGQTLYVAGINVAIVGVAPSAVSQLGAINSTTAAGLVDGTELTTLVRDFTMPFVAGAGNVLQHFWIGTGAPPFLVTNMIAELV